MWKYDFFRHCPQRERTIRKENVNFFSTYHKMSERNKIPVHREQIGILLRTVYRNLCLTLINL